MATLYELTADMLTLQEMAENEEISPEAFANTMEFLEEELEEKLDGYGKIFRMLQADEENYKAEIERLEKKKKNCDAKAKAMKERIETSLLLMDKKKVKTPLFTFSIQKNAPSLDITTEEFIPDEFYIEQEPKLNRTGLLDVVKAGREIEGVSMKQSESLRIR